MAETPSITAGQAALRAGQWDEARSIFEAVLQAHETADVLMGLAEAWWWLGDPRRTVEHFERGYVLSRRAGDIEAAVWSAIWLALTYGADFGNRAAFSGWLGRAERALQDAETSAMAGWVRLVKAHDTSDLHRSRSLAEEVLESARNSGDADLELCSLALLGEILVAMAQVEKGLALIDEAMAGTFGGERTRPLTAVFTCCNMIAACEMAADTERATNWCRIADGFIQEYGCPFLHATCRAGYGNILAATGQWADAERELETAVRLARDTFPPIHANALARLAGLRLNQGRLEEAELLLAKAGDHPAAALPAARLRLVRGEAAVAVALLERQLELLGGDSPQRASILEGLVEAHLAAGAREAAAAAADDLDALAGQHQRDVITARANKARGALMKATEDHREAARRLEAAMVKFSAAGLPLETARTRLELSRLLSESQPEVAVAEARTALAAFEQLGASADADAAGALLRSLGVTGRTGPKNLGVLTRRETEVLRLIGHGLSNPEIAERLVISRKTASHHVSSVLSKLGLRTRAEAAAYATREGDIHSS